MSLEPDFEKEAGNLPYVKAASIRLELDQD